MKLRIAAAVFTTVIFSTGLAQAQQYTWKLVIPANPGQPLYDQSVKQIKEEVKARSGGKMDLNLFAETAMGTGPEIVQNLRAGVVEMHWQAFAITSSYVNDFEFTSLPFIFGDREHFKRFMATEAGSALLTAAEAKGVYVMASNLIGYRFPVSRSKLLETPEDFKGVRIRTMENKMQISTMQALGANPVVLPYGEVYQSIQTGLVDGFFNDRNAFEYLSIHEVAPYFTELPLFSLGLGVAVSKRAFDALPEDLREVVRQVITEKAPRILDRQWKYNVEEEEWRTTLFKKQTKVADITPFVEMVEPVYASFVEKHAGSKKYIDAVNASR